MISKKRSNLAELSPLQPVFNRFPEARVTLERLFRESTSFQSLCDDFRDCLEALRHWEQSVSEEAAALAKSYTELLGELEQEIGQFLEDAQTFRGSHS